MATVTLTFEAGTIRIDSDAALDADTLPETEYDPRSETLRAPAYR